MIYHKTYKDIKGTEHEEVIELALLYSKLTLREIANAYWVSIGTVIYINSISECRVPNIHFYKYYDKLDYIDELLTKGNSILSTSIKAGVPYEIANQYNMIYKTKLFNNSQTIGNYIKVYGKKLKRANKGRNIRWDDILENLYI